MPDYKKKKHSRIASVSRPRPKKSKKETSQSYDIPMFSSLTKKKSAKRQNMKVVKGKKLEKRKKILVVISVIAAVAICFSVLSIAFPMGITESLGNTISLIGTGGYPLALESTQTINVVSRGSYYYVLSNTHVYSFTNAGKKLFSYAHGLENPVIKTSASRAFVFEQGGNQAFIFTHSGLKESLSFEKKIITANISDSGNYAVATESDKYTCAVTVFTKRNKKLYEWFSAEDIVNNLVISPNGKKLAVSVFTSKNGRYTSKVNVLNFKSATPEFSETFENSLIYNLNSTYKSGFTVVTQNKIKFVKWFKYKEKEYTSDYSTALFRTGKNGFVVVFNRESDKTDNKIAVFSKSGKLRFEIAYRGIISDIAVLGSHIYCMSDSTVNLLSSEGEVLRKASYGFGAVRLVATSTNTCAVITDNKIEKIKLEPEEKK